MQLSGNGPYIASGIEIHTNSRVASVNVAERTVDVNGREDVSYDKLLFTTGIRMASGAGGRNVRLLCGLIRLYSYREEC